jgi:hypothetical protein
MRDPADPPKIETHLSRGSRQMLRGIEPLNSPDAMNQCAPLTLSPLKVLWTQI